MASLVWGRHPQEAHDNPYEYGAQDQFIREAKELLNQLQIRLDCFTMRFHRDDRTLEKATWMLAVDLIDALQESLGLLEEKRHRIAFRLFRDIVESVDLLRVLHSATPLAEEALDLWYKNITIAHIKSRMHIEAHEGKSSAFKRKEYYEQLSKFTHRTYLALLKSYSLGCDDMLVHDSHSMRMLVLPQTIASGLAVLADLILQTSECLTQCGSVKTEEMSKAWLVALEIDTVPRRFNPVRPLVSYI